LSGQVILPPLNPKNWFSALLPKSAQPENTKRTSFVLAVTFLLAAILLFLALRGLDWYRFFQTLRNVRYAWMPLVFAWSSLLYFIRAARWRILLQAEKPVQQRDVFWANMAGYLCNNLLPARAGELVRAAYLGAKTQISASFILATGLAERLMDLVALVLLGSFALSTSGLVSPLLQKALLMMSGIGIIGLIFMLILPRFSSLLEKSLTLLPLKDETLKMRVNDLLHQFLHGLQALIDIRRASGFGLLTALIWLMDGLGIVFTGYILNIHITLLQAFVLLAGLGLSSAIPSTPGYVGVYQFVAVTVLGAFEIQSATALALILFAQISNWLVIGGWGLAALAQFSRKVDG
jgi:glycosyltransferase 2 family protein